MPFSDYVKRQAKIREAVVYDVILGHEALGARCVRCGTGLGSFIFEHLGPIGARAPFCWDCWPKEDERRGRHLGPAQNWYLMSSTPPSEEWREKAIKVLRQMVADKQATITVRWAAQAMLSGLEEEAREEQKT